MNVGENIFGRLEPLGAYGTILGKNFAPKVSVAVAADPNWNPGDTRLPHGMKGGLTALIDTGSDLTRIDTALVRLFNLNPIGTIGSSFTGIRANTDVYKAQIIFPEVRFVAGGEVTAVSLRDTGNYHDVILGIDVISSFDFLLSTKRNVVQLTWVGM